MKRKIFMILFMVCILLVAADVIRLFFMKEKEPETAHSQYQYVFLAHKKEKFWLDVASGVKEADREMGSDTLLVQYKDFASVGSYVRDAVLSGAKGIIMQGNEWGNEAIKEAKLAGVPILFYDGDYLESGRTAYIGNDNVELGRMAARALIDAMGEAGE